MTPTFVAIDFETADYGADSACAVGLIRVESGAIVAREARLIRPPRRQMYFTHIHGLTWLDVGSQPCFGDVWPTLVEMLDGAEFLVAHNAGFDRSVLHACCTAANLQPPPAPFACSMTLARRVWKLRPTRLPDVCRYLNLQLKHHDALSDAEAAARIALAAIGAGATIRPMAPRSAWSSR